MSEVDITVVVDTVDGSGVADGLLRLRRRGFRHQDRVSLEWGDNSIVVNLSKLRDAVKVLGAVER